MLKEVVQFSETALGVTCSAAYKRLALTMIGTLVISAGRMQLISSAGHLALDGASALLLTALALTLSKAFGKSKMIKVD